MRPLAVTSLCRSLAAGLAIASVAAGAALGQAPRLDVPYIPTPQAVVDRMLALAQVKPDDFVVDLGSGDGRILVTAAKRYGARGFGVDIDPTRIAEARENAKAEGVADKIEFRQQNLFETKIDEASVLTMYLLQRINLELKPRILNELRPGTRVVSHVFNLGRWQPDAHETVQNRDIYMWVVPAKVEGRWQLAAGDRRVALDLKQEFQKIEGTATVDGAATPIRNPRLRGREIEFTLDLPGGARTFAGVIDGDAIVGRDDWRATRSGT